MWGGSEHHLYALYDGGGEEQSEEGGPGPEGMGKEG